MTAVVFRQRPPDNGAMSSFPILCGSIASHASQVGQQVHNDLYQALGLNYSYVAFRVTDGPEAIRAMRALEIRGFGVSMPHKETIMSHLDTIDPVAREIGAVNTVVNDDGVLTGYNFDWLGVVRAVEEMGTTIERQRTVVVGAGGAARAAAFGLKKRGASNVTIFNRTIERGKRLARNLGVNFGGDLSHLNADYDILVHATSAGHPSQPGVCVIPTEILTPGKIVFDVVCEPLPTPLQERATEAGCTTAPGYRMRLHQAAAQFELYTGVTPPLDAMGTLLLEAMGLETP
ncbi:MAG: shikimate dehydrogenase [Planctomycetes bacterium]|nr:shikimate dehydrogenase [Planctomycetota bacterium]